MICRKLSLFVSLLFILSQPPTFAQFNSDKYDKECFLLGTLNESMGYQRTFSGQDSFYYQRVDILRDNELQNALYIDSLFSIEYSDITIVNNGAPYGLKIYSPKLSKRIDYFYKYKTGAISTESGEKVSSGTVKTELLASEKQQLSYLLGAWTRYNYGNIKECHSFIDQLINEGLLDKNLQSNDSLYLLSFPNGASKAKVCVTLLKELSCTAVQHVFRRTIPAGHYVLFKASPVVKEIIGEAVRIQSDIHSIKTSTINFKPDGSKYIWVDPSKPSFRPQQELDLNLLEGVEVKAIEEVYNK